MSQQIPAYYKLALITLCISVLSSCCTVHHTKSVKPTFAIDLVTSGATFRDIDGEPITSTRNTRRLHIELEYLRKGVGSKLARKLEGWRWVSDNPDYQLRIQVEEFHRWKRRFHLAKFVGAIFIPVPGAVFAFGFPVHAGRYNINAQLLDCNAQSVYDSANFNFDSTVDLTPNAEASEKKERINPMIELEHLLSDAMKEFIIRAHKQTQSAQATACRRRIDGMLLSDDNPVTASQP